MPGPGFRSFEAVEAGAVPPVSAFEGADPTFASGSPFDGSAECSALLDVLAGGTGPESVALAAKALTPLMPAPGS